VRQWYDAIIESLTCEQQPSAESLAQFVTDIAQHGLRVLDKKGLNIVHQLLAQFRTLLDRMPQVW
jgi:hypothetical protein